MSKVRKCPFRYSVAQSMFIYRLILFAFEQLFISFRAAYIWLIVPLHNCFSLSPLGDHKDFLSFIAAASLLQQKKLGIGMEADP